MLTRPWVDDPEPFTPEQKNAPAFKLREFKWYASMKVVPEELKGETPEFREEYAQYLKSLEGPAP
jgi:hypothetical protein